MERNTIRYYLRRKAQVIAHKIFSNETMSKIYFRILLHKELNLDDPQTFNEKIRWMNLYYYPTNPLVVKAADKYAVREYIKNKGYEKKLVPLLGVWDKAEDIEWNRLPNKFVLKCNHGCAYNILVPDKTNHDIKKTTKKLNSWLKEDFSAFNIELHYSAIKKHRIICEEFLGDIITDYKFFCFNGEPLFLYVSENLIHDRQAQMSYFYVDGRKMPFHRDEYAELSNVQFPSFYNEMVEAARVLSKDFPFVRVDFFIANDTWYFAELTFTPSGGFMDFNPEIYDLEWGRLIDIKELQNSPQR